MSVLPMTDEKEKADAADCADLFAALLWYCLVLALGLWGVWGMFR